MRSQARGERKSVAGQSQAVKRSTSRSPGQSSPARVRAAKALTSVLEEDEEVDEEIEKMIDLLEFE